VLLLLSASAAAVASATETAGGSAAEQITTLSVFIQAVLCVGVCIRMCNELACLHDTLCCKH
jgi:hypothetical protein